MASWRILRLDAMQATPDGAIPLFPASVVSAANLKFLVIFAWNFTFHQLLSAGSAGIILHAHSASDDPDATNPI
jgi:hypothetical protein